VRLLQIAHQSGSDYTRILLDVEAAIRYRSVWVGNPDRLYLDLPDVELAAALRSSTIEVNDVLVKRIRTAVTGARSARVVLDLNAPALLTVIQQSAPPRMILELHPREPVVVSSGRKPVRNASPGNAPKNTATAPSVVVAEVPPEPPAPRYEV